MLHAPSFSGVTCKVRVGKHPRLHKNQLPAHVIRVVIQPFIWLDYGISIPNTARSSSGIPQAPVQALTGCAR